MNWTSALLCGLFGALFAVIAMDGSQASGRIKLLSTGEKVLIKNDILLLLNEGDTISLGRSRINFYTEGSGKWEISESRFPTDTIVQSLVYGSGGFWTEYKTAVVEKVYD